MGSQKLGYRDTTSDVECRPSSPPPPGPVNTAPLTRNNTQRYHAGACALPFKGLGGLVTKPASEPHYTLQFWVAIRIQGLLLKERAGEL